MADWTVAPFYALAAKWNNNTGQTSWVFYNNGNGILRFVGSNVSGVNSSVAVPFADGTYGWCRVTKTATAVKFWTSTDGSTWTQLGTDQAALPTADSTAVVEIGGQTLGTVGAFLGRIRKFQLRNGVDGTLVNSFDATAVTKTATRTPTTVVASTGETWTANGAAWDWVT